MDTGLREENASTQEPRAPFRFHRNGKGSRPWSGKRLRRSCSNATRRAPSLSRILRRCEAASRSKQKGPHPKVRPLML
ncbi:hypothetical protein CWS35_02200 [Bradyrhizobium sp. SK17]|nr:hypothetical protein CWS35_02200 [Bradyrhizobium sp. SK17]